MLQAKLKNNSGQSLVELLVAIGIFTLGIVALGLLAIDATVSARQGVERTEALLLAQEGLEAVRSLRDSDFDNIPAGTYGLAISSNRWTLSGSSDITGQFTRNVVITDVDVDTKKIVSTVTWQFTPARQNQVSLTEYLTDWNQTHGAAGDLSINISDAKLSSGNKRLEGIKIENNGSASIIIDRIVVSWDNSRLIEEIRIDNSTVWKWNGAGTPDGRQSSGTELDITNFTLSAGADSEIKRIDFDGSMSGATFFLKFIFTDGSTKYVSVKP